MSVVVLGCGPAGVVTAIGLVRLGHEVTVIGQRRDFPVIEGISPRVRGALADFGLGACVKTLSEPVAREVAWNGELRSANTEYLVDRPEFESALLSDLVSQGGELIPQRIREVSRCDGQWVVDSESAGRHLISTADYLVDARGRATRLGRVPRVRGPETVSLIANWHSRPDAPMVAVTAVEVGWLWLARSAAGRLFAQLTTCATHPELPDKRGIPELILEQLASSEFDQLVHEFDALAAPALARSSTPILVTDPVYDHSIRVGDAAMAVDPLSGNGIFQSLSSALVAPAVVNTLLQRPDESELARSFYRSRLRHLFYRFARTGRDFYRLESRWQGSEFWKVRARWPDLEPAHVRPDRVLGTASRPVLNHGFIEQADVVITEDQPLGIWRIGDRLARDVLLPASLNRFEGS